MMLVYMFPIQVTTSKFDITWVYMFEQKKFIILFTLPLRIIPFEYHINLHLFALRTIWLKLSLTLFEHKGVHNFRIFFSYFRIFVPKFIVIARLTFYFFRSMIQELNLYYRYVGSKRINFWIRVHPYRQKKYFFYGEDLMFSLLQRPHSTLIRKGFPWKCDTNVIRYRKSEDRERGFQNTKKIGCRLWMIPKQRNSVHTSSIFWQIIWVLCSVSHYMSLK